MNSGADRDPLEVMAEEFTERFRRGERPAISDYTSRHPHLADQILQLFPALVAMEGAATPGFAHDVANDDSAIPDRLGEYRILRKLGAGGMGVVYEAVQESLGRHVALKVLPFHGRISPSRLERFRLEARAAARLHHTNIVPVFGVGEADGLNYYAMQFIDGQPLDRVFDEVRRLRSAEHAAIGAATPMAATSIASGLMGEPCQGRESTDQRSHAAGSQSDWGAQREGQYYRTVADLGIQVADALAYAHQQGVIHRDIKPANLLLDLHGTVWVTDFGLAKVEDSSELTTPGDVVGTLRYLAPECFRGPAGFTSDVYSLGITLYELATLRPAFDPSDGMPLREQVQLREPLRPRRVDRRIPRDLETIILKASAKEPDSRYPTAAALRDDLRRFLAGEPILARPTPVWERAAKWARRRPMAAALVAVVAFSLATVTLVSLIFNARLGRANHLLKVEKTKLQIQGERAAALAAEEHKQRRRAEAKFEETRVLVDDYYTRVSEDQLLTVPRMKPLRRDLLMMAAQFYERFSREAAGDRTALAGRARALARLARITEDIGSATGAIEYEQQAIELYRDLAKSDPGAQSHRRDLAVCLGNLGTLFFHTGAREKAETAIGEACEIFADLADKEPSDPTHHLNLAQLHNNLGRIHAKANRTDLADAAYQKALAAKANLTARFPEQPLYRESLATSLHTLGLLRLTTGRIKDAEADLQQALDIRKSLADALPTRDAHRSAFAASLNAVGRLHLGKNAWADAEKAFRQAEEIFQSLVRAHPESTEHRAGLAQTQNHLGRVYQNLGQSEQAESCFEAGLAVQQALVASAPDVPDYQDELARMHNYLGQHYLERKLPIKAESSYCAAIEVLSRLVRACPEVPAYRRDLARSQGNLANLRQQTGRLAEAESLYLEAMAVMTALAKAFPDTLAHRNDLAKTWSNLGAIYYSQRQHVVAAHGGQIGAMVMASASDGAQAIPAVAAMIAFTPAHLAVLAFEQAVIHYRLLVETVPSEAGYRKSLAGTLNNLAAAYSANRHSLRAEACYREAIQELTRLVQSFPAASTYLDELVTTFNNLTLHFMSLGQADQAEAVLRESAETLERFALSRGAESALQRRLAIAYGNVARFHREQKRPEAAVIWSRKAVRTMDTALAQQPNQAATVRLACSLRESLSDDLLELNLGGEAESAWNGAVKSASPASRGWFVLGRACCLARMGNYSGAASDAGAVSRTKPLPPAAAYELARVYTQCAVAVRRDNAVPSEKRAEASDSFAGQAVAMLRTAQSAGYFASAPNRDRAFKDAYLQPLRSMEKHRAIFAELAR